MIQFLFERDFCSFRLELESLSSSQVRDTVKRNYHCLSKGSAEQALADFFLYIGSLKKCLYFKYILCRR